MKYFGTEIRHQPLVITGSTATFDLGINSGSTAI